MFHEEFLGFEQLLEDQDISVDGVVLDGGPQKVAQVETDLVEEEVHHGEVAHDPAAILHVEQQHVFNDRAVVLEETFQGIQLNFLRAPLFRVDVDCGFQDHPHKLFPDLRELKHKLIDGSLGLRSQSKEVLPSIGAGEVPEDSSDVGELNIVVDELGEAIIELPFNFGAISGAKFSPTSVQIKQKISNRLNTASDFGVVQGERVRHGFLSLHF